MFLKILLLILTMLSGDGGLRQNPREPAKPTPPQKVCVFVETPSGLVRKC